MVEKSKDNKSDQDAPQGLMRQDSSTTSRKPLLAWESTEQSDKDGIVIWTAHLDERYQVEVQRTGKCTAVLALFDHESGDKNIFEKEVGLSYGALFGPDVADVELWQQMTVDYLDNRAK